MRYKNITYLPYILFIICLITRLVFFGRYIDDWDGVNFAFALSDKYDVLHDQPHFHGYPVYMFVSWIIYNICHSDINALIIPGIIFSSLAIIPLYALVYRMFSWQVAILTSVLYIVNPQVWLQAEKTLSDAFGLFFVVLFAYFFYRAIEPIADCGLRNSDCEIKGQNSSISNLQSSIHGQTKFVHATQFNQSSIINRKSSIVNRKSAIPPNPPLEKGGMGGFAIPNPQSEMWLFLGSLALGLGIGVRISYMAFIVTWGFVVFIVCRRISVKKGVLYGFGGLGFGIIVWLGYLLGRFGIVNYLEKFTSHSNYHFSGESYSILTSTDYLDRLMTIFKNIFAHSQGVYWFDTPLLRILPTVVMIIGIVTYIINEKMDLKNKFLLISIAAYVAWLIIVQTAVRHTMVLVPFILILISAGIFYFVKNLKTENRQRRWLLPVMLFFIIVPMSFDSGRLVWINRESKPPQVALIDYIANNYDKDTSKFYCLNTWRLFQYYAPEWRDEKNRYVYFTSKVSKVEQNLRNRHPEPENVLVSSKLYERHKYKDRLRKVKAFKRDNYAVAEYNSLALYEFDANRGITDKRLVDDKTASELAKILASLAVIQNSNELKRKGD